MSEALPAGFLTIEEAEPPSDGPDVELSCADYSQRDRRQYETTNLPERCATGTPQQLTAKLYACSGGLDSTRYMEAPKLRDMPSMEWEEARVALNRLVVDLKIGVHSRYRYRSSYKAANSDLVALAEFALTARSFDFKGKKGEHAPKFRKERVDAVTLRLHPPLSARLQDATHDRQITARPIVQTMQGRWQPNDALLHARVPLPDGGNVKIIEATPEQAMASLGFVRHWLADREMRRAFADDVAQWLLTDSEVTAADYAEALFIADGLKFMYGKLAALQRHCALDADLSPASGNVGARSDRAMVALGSSAPVN